VSATRRDAAECRGAEHGLVREFALAGGSAPSAKAGRGDADDLQDPVDASHPAGAADSVQEATLTLGLDSDARQIGTQDAQQREQDPQRACQPGDPGLQLGDADMEVRSGFIEARRCRDGRERSSKLARSGRARDIDARRDRGVTCVPDET
jgi:hypothetical protein